MFASYQDVVSWLSTCPSTLDCDVGAGTLKIFFLLASYFLLCSIDKWSLRKTLRLEDKKGLSFSYVFLFYQVTHPLFW